jgi:hypothetical protein
VLCKSQEEYDEPMEFYQRALAVFERALGERRLKAVACRDNFRRPL